MHAREFVLRSIPNAGNYYDKEHGIQTFAFEPRKKHDDDGLSFYRLDFILPRRLAEKNRHPNGVYYAIIRARDIVRLSLTLRPQIDDLPGHVIVPEMNSAAYKTRKREVKDMMIALTQIASARELWGPSPSRVGNEPTNSKG